MNDLSWFLYFAGVSQGVGVVSTILGVITILGGGFVFVSYAIGGDFDEVKQYFGRTVGFAVAMLFIAVIVPSKTTVYAIAASEAGESALQSKTGGKAMKALDAWLDRQISGESEED